MTHGLHLHTGKHVLTSMNEVHTDRRKKKILLYLNIVPHGLISL